MLLIPTFTRTFEKPELPRPLWGSSANLPALSIYIFAQIPGTFVGYIFTACDESRYTKTMTTPTSQATHSLGLPVHPTGMTDPKDPPTGLKIAFLCYRGNPRCGGQGVYTRYLTRDLVAMGHQVEVFAGPPYPELEPGVVLNKVPSLDLYRDPDPFRIPRPREFKSLIDLAEFAIMCTAGFPEPLAFSWRVKALLETRVGDFDLVHDNQCLGRGLTGIMEMGLPLVETIHHPITVDRELDLAHATSLRRKLSLRRWYGFLGMQMKIARTIPNVITVSSSSKRDIAEQMGVPLDRMSVVPVGVDHTIFRPLEGVERVKGRIMTTASADVPMKGLVPLLRAVAILAKARTVELVVIGRLRPESKIPKLIDDLGITSQVRFVSGISDDELVKNYAETELAVVPSLYEGFSLPAIEAMACGVPVVGTTGGAIPEVVGTNGDTGILVQPNHPEELAEAIGLVMDDPVLAKIIGQGGRKRVLDRFTWRETARGTLKAYDRALGKTSATEVLEDSISRPGVAGC